MNRCFTVLLAVCLLLLRSMSAAYELRTHQQFSTDAANRSILAQASFLRSIGIERTIGTQKYPDSREEIQSIEALIGQGAVFEDTLTKTRVRHHFFNPVDDKGLNRYFTSLGTASPSWVLEDDGQKDVALDGEQKYSYRDARGYYLDALTNPAKLTRDQRFGNTFESLGHVVHHLQDMTQPAHARNDLHLNFNDVFDTISVNNWLNRHIGNPSQLELWAERDDILLNLPRDPAQVGYDINSADFKRIFSSPRKFWKTGYLSGIAEYANHGFVSPGTNFGGNPSSGIQSNSTFQFPNGDAIEIENLPINDPSLMGASADRLGLFGQVQLIKKPVGDQFLGTSSEKIRLSAFSIFTDDTDCSAAAFNESIQW